MSGINKIVSFAVNRLKVTFKDSSGATKMGTGTGFWLELNAERRVFITNKHVVDPTVTFGPSTDFELETVELELRKRSDQTYYAETQFFMVKEPKKSLLISEFADCAIIIPPNLHEFPRKFQPSMVLTESDLADQKFFAEKVQIMDFTSFIGFPASTGGGWWDRSWNMPIARFASIASWPEIPFTNDYIKTGNVTLVTGLSFSGSSGSPIILHEKGIRTGPGLDNPDYVGPKVLGIMSGHWWEAADTPEMFIHSGLSYYTRSTAILDLLYTKEI
jgi:hypothetical protein